MSRSARALAAALVALTGVATAPRLASSEAPARGSSLGNLVVRAGLEASVYADSDNVSVVTPTVSGRVEDPLSGWAVGGRYLVDVVTAASADIVATATPRWREVRHVVSGSASYKPGDLGGDLQVSASIEPDYVSFAAGAMGTWDLKQKNITLLLGYGYGNDTVGRARTPFDVFSRKLHRHTFNGGATWVVNRSTVMTLVADVVLERGDQSKPYRYVPMFNPGTGARIPAGASYDEVNRLRADDRPLEQLPLTRERVAATARLAHRLSASTLRIEERLYLDSWGVLASTTDLRHVFEPTPRLSLWPHVRAHLQGGASFWRRAYELSPGDGGQLVAPALRTGDRELGPLRSFTAGAGAQIDLSEHAGARRWVLTAQAESVLTHYLDTLYIQRRNTLLAVLAIDATWD